MGSKSAIREDNVMVITMLLFCWFAASVGSTLTNKTLIDHFPYPVSISAIHMLASVVVDAAVLKYRQLPFYPIRTELIRCCLPVAFSIALGKVLTYVSYEFVTASLTHTAKASAPLFSVLMAKVIFNQMPKLNVCLSLVPLTLGVVLSAVTEIDVSLVGFLAAVTAALAGVLNSLYSKRALDHASTPDPLVFHMYTGAVGFIMLLPWAAFTEFPDIFAGSHLGKEPVTSRYHSPFVLVPLSLFFHYTQNISSVYYLSHVTVLTHTVSQSLKRLFVISGSVFFFHTRVTPMNMFGMALALLGFFWYSMAKNLDRIQGRNSQLIHPHPTGKDRDSIHLLNGVDRTNAAGADHTAIEIAQLYGNGDGRNGNDTDFEGSVTGHSDSPNSGLFGASRRIVPPRSPNTTSPPNIPGSELLSPRDEESPYV